MSLDLVVCPLYRHITGFMKYYALWLHPEITPGSKTKYFPHLNNFKYRLYLVTHLFFTGLQNLYKFHELISKQNSRN